MPGVRIPGTRVTFQFMALNGGPEFACSPAISFFVKCETQQEIDGCWDRLMDGGEPVQCGWIKDRFGVTWQIVPNALARMLQGKDAAKAKCVMEAMMKMIKLDINVLEEAYRRE